MRTVTKLAASLLGLLSIVLLILLGLARRDEKRARNCMTQVLSLDMPNATFDDANRISRRYGGTSSASIGRKCSPAFCDFLITFNNQTLHRFRLAPFTAFSVGIVVSNGHVTNRGIQFLSDGQPYYAVDEVIASRGNEELKIRMTTDLYQKPNRIMVKLTTRQSPDTRTRAFSVNLSCLSKLGSCRDALPADFLRQGT